MTEALDPLGPGDVHGCGDPLIRVRQAAPVSPDLGWACWAPWEELFCGERFLEAFLLCSAGPHPWQRGGTLLQGQGRLRIRRGWAHRAAGSCSSSAWGGPTGFCGAEAATDSP